MKKELNRKKAKAYIERLEAKLEKYNINYNKEVMPRKFEDKVTYYNYLANIYEENTNAIASMQEAKYAANKEKYDETRKANKEKYDETRKANKEKYDETRNANKEKYAENREVAMNKRIEQNYEDYLRILLVRYSKDKPVKDLNLYNFYKAEVLERDTEVDSETGEIKEVIKSNLGEFPRADLGWTWKSMFEHSHKNIRAQLMTTNKRAIARTLSIEEQAVEGLRSQAVKDKILLYISEYSYSNSTSVKRSNKGFKKSRAYFVDIDKLLKRLGLPEDIKVDEDETLKEIGNKYYRTVKELYIKSERGTEKMESLKKYSEMPFVQWVKEQWELVNRTVPENFKMKFVESETTTIGTDEKIVWSNKRAACPLCAMLNPSKYSIYDEILGRNRFEQEEMLKEYFKDGSVGIDITSAIPRMNKNILNYSRGEAFIDAMDDCYYLINDIMRASSEDNNYRQLTREQFKHDYSKERAILKENVLPTIMNINRTEWLRGLNKREVSGATLLNQVNERILKNKLGQYAEVTGIEAGAWLELLRKAIENFYECEGKTYLPEGETFIMEAAVFAIIRRKFLELGIKCVNKYDEFFFDRDMVVFGYGFGEFEELFNSVVNSAIKEAMEKAIELKYDAVTPYLKNLKKNNKQ